MRGDVSSQFLTALLLALPLVAQPQAIVIEVVGELISRPYIEITLNLLARFGVRGAARRLATFHHPGRQPLPFARAHRRWKATPRRRATSLRWAPSRPAAQGITIEGVGLASIQGDIRFVEAARLMGAEITGEANRLHIRRGAWPLKAIDLDCNHIPDAAMTLAVMALYADGTTTLRNIASWRVKETDRIAAMANECRKLGATVEEGADFIRITPPTTWRAASIHTYDDHRVAMCFSLAAFNPAGLPVRIEDPKCVGKTFPDYFETLFEVCSTPAPGHPRHLHRRPHGLGQGHAGFAAGTAPGLPPARLRALCTAPRRSRHKTPACRWTTSRRWPAWRPTCRWRSATTKSFSVAATSPTRCAWNPPAAWRPGCRNTWPVRTALHALQQSFRRLPGLVADGRDMGTVIFPDAALKVFLTATAEQRAQRRHKQLISKGIAANIDSLLADLRARDLRDSSRTHAPLKPAEDALKLDNSELDIEQSVQSGDELVAGQNGVLGELSALPHLALTAQPGAPSPHA